MPSQSLARLIFGQDLLGSEELVGFAVRHGLLMPGHDDPEVPEAFLEAGKREPGAFMAILGSSSMVDGSPLTLCTLRARLGMDPEFSEPCFYNQDWYLKEAFANQAELERRWYLLRKKVRDDSRGLAPMVLAERLKGGYHLPSALLCAYAFFAHWFNRGGEMLWESDYVWCSDQDHQGDQIYVGRYSDPSGVNKNGFSVHRHLSIRNSYGMVECSF